MALTKAHNRMIAGSWLNVIDFGAVGDGVADDTVAIQAAINVAYAAGGGTIYFPVGQYLVTGLSLDWGSSLASIKFIGDGQSATVIKKTGASSNAIFTLSANASDGTYSEFSDMRINGNGSVDGFKITALARNVWRNVRIDNCDNGVNNLGSLINSFYDCNLLSNNVGIVTRNSLFPASGGIFSNLIQMFGGSVRGNSNWGFDIGSASAFNLYGVDVEVNGTVGGTGGGLITRPTVDDEYGLSTITITNSWFEGNFGTSIYASAAPGLSLCVKDTLILNAEAGAAITAEAIGYLNIDNLSAASATDTVVSSAGILTLKNSIIGVLSNSSSNFTIENTKTFAGSIQSVRGGATGEFVVNGDTVKSESGSVTVPDSSATTLFTVSGEIGMYQVFACLPSIGAGTQFKAAAIIGWDAAGAGYISGANGASLSISLAGNNVQATQTSGLSQSVYYAYQKIGG